MQDEQKSGASELLEKGASAASLIKGAVKTGKAVSSIAKGAAAGGPYGAIAGALWDNRKVIGKIIIGIIALLMIPVIFVMMLPGLIFGGLTEAYSLPIQIIRFSIAVLPLHMPQRKSQVQLMPFLQKH